MRVLITEDDKSIQLLLAKQIGRWGFEISTADDGQQAVDAVCRDDRPDIIVMDWMMPRLSGIEACQAIKSMRDLPMVYILILTSKHDRGDLITGLNAGADDYLTKPVDSGELHSRLKVAERTIDYERRLRSYASQMEQLARERADQLVHADRLATIGTLSSGIAHEISSPLSAIMGNAQLMQMYWRHIETHLQEPIRKDAELARYCKDVPEMLASLDTSANRIANLVSTIKRFYRKQNPAEREAYALNDCVKNALQICWTKLKYEVTLEQNLEEPSPQVLVSPQQLDQVLINVLVNAYEALTANELKKGMIRITTGQEAGWGFIRVFDDGPAIPQEMIDKIWEAFYTTKEHGTGLGLSISSGIMRDHGGELRAENCEGGGVCFTLRLPAFTASGTTLETPPADAQ